jgi:outer membrane protein assembly factor BamB
MATVGLQFLTCWENAMKRSAWLPVLVAVLTAGLTLTVTGAVAATQAPLWVTHQDVVKGGINAQVAASPDGSAVFVAGQRNKRTDVAEAVLWAYDPATGAARWQDKYTATAQSLFAAVAVSPDSATVFATGRAQATSRSASNYLTVAYNAATGAQVWADNSAPHGRADAIVVSPDGSAVFVTGATGTVAYNAATGAPLWTVGTGGSAIAVSPDGSAVYLTGALPFGYRDRHTAYLTTALDTATGDTLWHEQYDVPKGNSSPAAVAVSPDGSAVFVTGSTIDQSGKVFKGATVAYNSATGARLWVRSFPSNSSATALVVSPDGSTVYVTGSQDGSPDPIFYGEYLTAAYDTATGAARWTARYRGPASGLGGPARDVAVSPDGAKVIVTGDNSSASPGSQPEFATVAYDSGTGAQVWVARYGQPAKQADYGVSVTVSPDSSKVFVTGDTGNDGTTLAYNS